MGYFVKEDVVKKIVFCTLALVLALSVSLAAAPQTANAVGNETWVLPLADSAIPFTTVNVDTAAKTAPIWLQQFSEGIQIEKSTKICYPFRYGQFHWVPQILRLTDGIWSTVNTTKEYLSGEEGTLYACAVPTSAGTFSLFAYYNGPVEVIRKPSVKSFTVDEWTLDRIEYASGYSITNLIANDVNWKGYYPTATKFAWGTRMCWDSVCRENPDGSIAINSITFPYPQNMDAIIIGTSSWYIYLPTHGETCEFKPFVELLDASDNVLDIIYLTDYADYCVS